MRSNFKRWVFNIAGGSLLIASMRKFQEQNEAHQASRAKMAEGMALALEKKDKVRELEQGFRLSWPWYFKQVLLLIKIINCSALCVSVPALREGGSAELSARNGAGLVTAQTVPTGFNKSPQKFLMKG